MRTATLVAAAVNRVRTWIIALVAIAGYTVAVWYGIGARAFRTWDFRDFDVYRVGAEAILNHHPLYSAHPVGSDLLFTYPPFAALVFVPLELGAVEIVRAGVTVISLGAAVVLAYACLRGAGRPAQWRTGWWALLLGGVALRSQPFSQALHLGQVDLIVVAMAAGDLLLVSHARRGWLLGVASGFKPTPLVLIGYLLVSRQWRAALQAVVGFALTVGVGFAILPGTSRLYWGTELRDVSRIGALPYVGNQSLTGLAARISGLAVPASSTMLTLGCVAVGCGLALGLVWQRRSGPGAAVGIRPPARELETVSLIAVAGLLASPVSWTHQWVWWLPVAVALAGRLVTARHYPALAGWGAALVIWSAVLWHGPAGIAAGSATAAGPGFGRHSIAGNVDVLAGIALLAGAGLYQLAPLLFPARQRPARAHMPGRAPGAELAAAAVSSVGQIRRGLAEWVGGRTSGSRRHRADPKTSRRNR